MRIVLDLQSLQGVSRQRGIGRYSLALAKAMIREGEKHEFLIALNQCMKDTVNEVRKELAGILPPENFVVFSVPVPNAELEPSNSWRCQAAELVREYFLYQLRPDWVYVASLFEGLGEDLVVSLDSFRYIPTAVTLYDLIPYRFTDEYQADPVVSSWYNHKLGQLRKAELVFAISEYTRRDVIDALQLPGDRVVNISGDADPQFRVLELSQDNIRELQARFGLTRDFVMYTGGINYRKNIEGLIQAFSLLPARLKTEHQLVISCKAEEVDRQRLLALASKCGLEEGHVVITGYVSDDDLVALYNLCKIFIFPSLAEGFGLPVLEAMRCGAPVIGSKTTSIPEVIGLESALFDPSSLKSISEKLNQVLTDDTFRESLRENSRVQAQKFSWDNGAKLVLEAMETLHDQRQKTQPKKTVFVTNKPRLAYFSPLPPDKSGIADYSSELLPELARYYKIDLITDSQRVSSPALSSFEKITVAEFKRSSQEYDRVLYQLGSSDFHTYMFPLISRYPGTVVLHDFFLSHVLHYMESTRLDPAAFRRALYHSHGYQALRFWYERGPVAALWFFPACLEVLEQAQGVIVHSYHSLQLAEHFFSLREDMRPLRIAQLCQVATGNNRTSARKILGLREDAFVICTFGIVSGTKLDDRLLDAWLQSDMSEDDTCYIFFVGNAQDIYVQSLRNRVTGLAAESRVRFTGFVSPETYRRYLEAADVAVQLRTRSRGETSRSALDCLAYGLPTIVNNHGSLAELPDDAVFKLPDQFSDAQLAEALEKLHSDPGLRSELGSAAMEYVKNNLDPADIALQYAEAIESFAEDHPVAIRSRLLSAITSIPAKERPENQDLAQAAQAIAEDTVLYGKRKILIDVGKIINNEKSAIFSLNILQQLLAAPPAEYRIEPIYRSRGLYRYARKFTGNLLGIGYFGLEDAPVDISPHDIFLSLEADLGLVNDRASQDWLSYNTQRGLKIYFILSEMPFGFGLNDDRRRFQRVFTTWFADIARIADGVLCLTEKDVEKLLLWFRRHASGHYKPLRIGCFGTKTQAVSYTTPDDKTCPNYEENIEQLKRVIFEDQWLMTWEPHEPTGSD